MKKLIMFFCFLSIIILSFSLPFSFYSYEKNPALINFSQRSIIDLGTQITFFEEENADNFADYLFGINYFGNIKFGSFAVGSYTNLGRLYSETGILLSFRSREFSITGNYIFYKNRFLDFIDYDNIISDLFNKGQNKINIGFVSGEKGNPLIGASISNITLGEEKLDLKLSSFIRIPLFIDIIPYFDYYPTKDMNNLDIGIFFNSNLFRIIHFYGGIENKEELWYTSLGSGIDLYFGNVYIDIINKSSTLQNIFPSNLLNFSLSIKFSLGI